jgi:hypothetical protein
MAISAVPELSELQFEILRAAVRLAKEDRISTTGVLRARLTGFYQEADVKVALIFWARCL